MHAPNAPRAPSSKSLSLVYNGTASSAQELADAKLRAEGQSRRARLDEMRRVVKTQPNNSRMYERKLGGTAHVIVEMQRRDGSVLEWLVCDLSTGVEPDGVTPELLLVVPCPVCNLFEGRVGETMLLRQSNRGFSFEQSDHREIWVNPNNPSEVYSIAGHVETHGHFRCGKCNSRYMIEIPTGGGRTVMRRD